MSADLTGTTAAGAALVGVRSGIVLDLDLMAALRVVAARAEVAHRVLALLEPGGEPTAPPAPPSRR
jgi:hypothetical protein